MIVRALLAALVAAWLSGCGAPDPLPRASSAHEDGRAIYNFRCYYCHGYSGDARTLASTFLEPRPRDFTAPGAAALPREAMLAAVREGREGTAMKAFGSLLSEAQIAAVVDFVREEFVRERRANTRYHTADNGWPRHERYRAAFPFATGEIALDVPWSELDPAQTLGKRLYMSACVSCHDRAIVRDEGAAWELRAVSYPPNADACAGCHVYSEALHGKPSPHDSPAAVASARTEASRAAASGPYALHDTPPELNSPSARALRGERIFQRNCAFCHAADGSGRNWIGAFLEPHPRDLSDARFMAQRSRAQLVAAIRDGLPNTSMPAWKSVLGETEIEAVAEYLQVAFGAARR